MIVYHGTTRKRAEQICAVGFLPKKPSRRVWFAETKRYALGRARTQARRTRDRPVVLTCEFDVGLARQRFGKNKVFHNNQVIAVKGKVPVSVLRSFPDVVDTPVTPTELADWVNRLLGLKRHKGVGSRHPGIERLSDWARKRLASRAVRTIKPRELVYMARRWVPEFFEGYVVDADHFKAFRHTKTIQVETVIDEVVPDQEAEALECLESPKAKRRIRGLKLLAEMGDPDLFEWCSMYLEDDSVEMRIAALHTMRHCPAIDPDVITPLADSEDKRIRAGAITALAKHAQDDKEYWCWLGLTDPSTCVRVETARVLPDLDPEKHRAVFSVALHDPNPEIARQAERLTRGKGYTTWR